jgi:hypothetical protein
MPELKDTGSQTDGARPGISGNKFLGLVAKNSSSCEIGAELLGIEDADSSIDVCKKIEKCIRMHSEHLTEILLVGLTAIAYGSESKEEVLESCVFAFGMADRAMTA